jgi:hypothetical protein
MNAQTVMMIARTWRRSSARKRLRRQELERENAQLRRLLIRYRTETPLGNQPAMIEHEVDAALDSVDVRRLVRRFEVQQRWPLQGWNTWVIYDDQRHADEECARRISEAALRDKNNWRVISSPNAPSEPPATL